MNVPSSIKKIPATCLLLSILVASSCSREKHYTDALSPEQALDQFQLHDGFEIELFASEPQVMDPVSMVFDAQGNIFVVEMPDYPYKPEAGQAQGRIKMLIDSNGDGRIDSSAVFADQLSEATSILPWEDGLLVTSAPNILYLRDTDGDFKADKEEILFSGFFANNSEAQITNLRFGVDNWIYAANHGQAGEVSFSRMPDAPKLAMQGGDFRFRLDRKEFELTTGPAQFGLAIDDWGHRFFTQNTIHIRHAVVPKRYVDQQDMPSSTEALNISDHDLLMYQLTPPPYWRAERTRRRQQQYDEQSLDRQEYAEDHFSGASGGTIYTGDAFPEEYYGNIFTGDVSGNLVHRDVLTSLDNSPTFVASRDASEQDKEFLASTDPWFRPVNFTVGPDGYLYVIDMYRQHIETPVSIPEDLKEDMDFLNGSERGRIYRIKPANAQSTGKAVPALNKMDTQQLADLLAHPNQWWRLQAQRLLLERQDKSAVPIVEAIFKEHDDPRARLHALYVLEGLDALNDPLVERAMTDEHPGVREHGVILAERFPACLPQLLKSVEDSSARVAFQASLSAGKFSDHQEVVSALARVAEQHAADPWFKTAVLSSDAGSSVELVKKLAESPDFFQDTTSWKVAFLKDLSYTIGSKNDHDQVVSLLDQLATMHHDWQSAGSQGLTESLKKHQDANPELKAVIETIEADTDTKPEEVIRNLRAFYSSSV